ncbi:unnamed protein product [Choristocarpus tenellus]
MLYFANPSVSGEGIRPGDIVEIYGASGCAKSEVLINVVVRYIMPNQLGGEEKIAVFFDNEGRLSTLRLEQLLMDRIKSNPAFLAGTLSSRGARARGEDLDNEAQARVPALVLGCLKRLKVVRPASTLEVLASIEVLRYELQHRAAVVAFDGMGTFYWQDKMAQGCGGEVVSLQGAAVRALTRLAKERPIMLFAAKAALFPSRGPGPQEHREYLPQTWQKAVTYRVVLQRQHQSPIGRTPEKTARGWNAGPNFSFFTARVTRPNVWGRGEGGRGGGRGGGGGGGGGTTGGCGSGGGGSR